MTMSDKQIVLIHFAASNCTNTTTQDCIDKYTALYGAPTQFTVEPVEPNDSRICWESITSLSPKAQIPAE
jgi:hypothetical protein